MKHLLKIIVIFLIYYLNFLYATSFAKTFSGLYDDIAYSIVETNDGGYIIAGRTNSFGAGSSDFLVIKLSYDGNILWTKTFGGENIDIATFIQETNDGGYIVAGYTNSFGAGFFDFLVIKLSYDGNILWTKTFGGTGYDIATSIQETNDGGYIVAGYTNSFGAGSSDFLVIKLSYDGNILWTKTFGGERNDELYSLELTNDGGYILIGCTNSFNLYQNMDVLIIKLSPNGDMELTKTFFGGETDEIAVSIQKTEDGGYIIAGYTYPLGAGDKDCLVLKLSSNYNFQWGKKFGGIAYDISNSIKQTNDGGYIFTGYTQSFGASGSVFAIKLFPNGIIEWAKIFGGGNIDEGNSIQQTSDGGYIIAGYTYSFGAGGYDFLIIKTHDNQMGSDCPWYSFYPTVNFADFTYSYPPPTITSPDLTFTSPLIIDLSPDVQTFDVCTPVEVEEIISSFKKDKISLIFPKYFKNNTKITLYNVLGKKIKEEKIEKLSKGIYFLKISSKMIKIINIK